MQSGGEFAWIVSVRMMDLLKMLSEVGLSCASEQACRMAEFHEPLLDSLPTTSSERMQLISGRGACFGRDAKACVCTPGSTSVVSGRTHARKCFGWLPITLRDHATWAF
jgi:hypothetical protein